MPDKTFDPMIPMLAGFLAGAVGHETFAVRKIYLKPPDGFIVEFGSGICIEVKLTEVTLADAFNKESS